MARLVKNEMLLRLKICDHREAERYAVVEVGSAAQARERLDGAMDRLAPVREVVRRHSDVAGVVISAQVTPKTGDLLDDVPFVGRPFQKSRIRRAISDAVASRSAAIHAGEAASD